VGHHEVIETVVLLPVDKVGLRFSKVRISDGGGEALVPVSSWNKSSLAYPCPVDNDELVEVGFRL
jgi:hypothetical protein